MGINVTVHSHHMQMLCLVSVLILFFAGPGSSSDEVSTCRTEGNCATEGQEHGMMKNKNDKKYSRQSSDSPLILEGSCEGRSSLYAYGGTAQAYKPGAPLSSVVCRSEVSENYNYKVATWPFTRRTQRKGSAPKLDISLKVWSCSEVTMPPINGEQERKCTCTPLTSIAATNASSLVEIWQTRPDGQYSSLRPLVSTPSDCRAQVPLNDQGVARFKTIAPGSTGVMTGLGPGGWESYPYGPPSIHLLFRVAGHLPLLLDLPILPDPTTLEERAFVLSDFRGAAWVRSSKSSSSAERMKITSWEPNVSKNAINIDVDVYVQQSSIEQVDFCTSILYGLPSSFFLEPIAVCAPSMLDFFAL